MFVLVQMKDTIAVHPSQFGRDQHDVLAEEIDAKYANKVMAKVGLFVCLRHLDDVGDSHVYDGDGSANVPVVFTMVVFRPFQGEVIVGNVKKCTKTGLYVSLGFFEDVFVPSDSLPQPSVFNADEQLWTWTYTDEETGEESEFFLDLDQPIRVEVTAVMYGNPRKSDGTHDADVESAAAAAAVAAGASEAAHTNVDAGASSGAAAGAGGAAGAGASGRAGLMDTECIVGGDDTLASTSKSDAELTLAMCVLARCNDEGLGIMAWWTVDEDGEEGAGEEVAEMGGDMAAGAATTEVA